MAGSETGGIPDHEIHEKGREPRIDANEREWDGVGVEACGTVEVGPGISSLRLKIPAGEPDPERFKSRAAVGQGVGICGVGRYLSRVG